MERLAREKIGAQQRLAVLKKDIMSHYDNIDFSKLLPEGNVSPGINISIRDEISFKDDFHEELSTNGNCIQNGESPELTAIPILTKANIPVVTQNLTTLKAEVIRFLTNVLILIIIICNILIRYHNQSKPQPFRCFPCLTR